MCVPREVSLQLRLGSLGEHVEADPQGVQVNRKKSELLLFPKPKRR